MKRYSREIQTGLASFCQNLPVSDSFLFQCLFYNNSYNNINNNNNNNNNSNNNNNNNNDNNFIS